VLQHAEPYRQSAQLNQQLLQCAQPSFFVFFSPTTHPQYTHNKDRGKHFNLYISTQQVQFVSDASHMQMLMKKKRQHAWLCTMLLVLHFQRQQRLQQKPVQRTHNNSSKTKDAVGQKCGSVAGQELDGALETAAATPQKKSHRCT